MALDITPVWKQITPELKDELVAFWKDNNALGNQARADLRADQVVCIARDKDGKICAVATAMVRILPRLRQPMYYYRHFFTETERGQRMTKPFNKRAKEILEEYNASLPKPESLGMLVELESEVLTKAYTRAYEPEIDYTFIGYSPRGFQLHVSYFKDAMLLPPAPLRKRMANGPRARGAGNRNH